MSLLNLAARVCFLFNQSNFDPMRTIQKVKENQSRDVVTDLDMNLHALSEKFVEEHLPNCNFFSEEGVTSNLNYKKLLDGDCLIVDPLDGSHNHSLGLPNYGYMAAYLSNGSIVGSVIVIPEHNKYIVFENNRILFSQPLNKSEIVDTGTVYYAYPPKQDSIAFETRNSLENLIDSNSSGMSRYGSACVGLYQLLCGKHKAFIGHEIRIWDAIGFFPILQLSNIQIKYYIKGICITLIASTSIDFLSKAEKILKTNQDIVLHDYFSNQSLIFESL